MVISSFDVSLKDQVTEVVDWKTLKIADLRKFRYKEPQCFLVERVDEMNPILQLELRGAMLVSHVDSVWLLSYTDSSKLVPCLIEDIKGSKELGYAFK